MIYFIVEQVITPGNIDPFGLFAVITIGIFTPIANLNTTLAKQPDVLTFSSSMGGMMLTGIVALGLILGLTHGLAF